MMSTYTFCRTLFFYKNISFYQNIRLNLTANVYLKNNLEAEILKRIQFCVLKFVNTIQLYVFN